MGSSPPATPARACRRARRALASLAWVLASGLAPVRATPATDAPAPEREQAPAAAESVETLWARGEAARAAGNLQEAQRLFTTALSADRNRGRSWNYLGAVQFELGQLPQALRSFRQAFELDPQDVRACNNLGTVLERLGELERARITYLRAVQTDPAYAPAHRNLGILEARLGRADAARRAWQRYLDLAPEGPGAAEVRNALAALPPR